MVSALLDAVFFLDVLGRVTAWFVDGVFWLFSPTRRAQIRSHWAICGRLYKYIQVISWFLALGALIGLVVFFWVVFAEVQARPA